MEDVGNVIPPPTTVSARVVGKTLHFLSCSSFFLAKNSFKSVTSVHRTFILRDTGVSLSISGGFSRNFDVVFLAESDLAFVDWFGRLLSSFVVFSVGFVFTFVSFVVIVVASLSFWSLFSLLFVVM